MPLAPGLSGRVLNALAAELERSRELAERLEPVLGASLGASLAGADPALIAEAQNLDRLRQKLEALSALAAGLAGGATLEAALDAVPLGDLAGRLRAAVLDEIGLDGTVLAEAPAQDAGDLLWFDEP